MYIMHAACTHGDIRLASISNPLEGLVEACYDGVWGTVCDSNWESAEASVVCHQLGFSSQGMSDVNGPLVSHHC